MLTLYTLSTFMNRDGFAYPSQVTVARGARASVRTIRRHMDQAERLGWVAIELAGNAGQGWRRHGYRCAVPDHVVLDESDEALADVVESQSGPIESSKRADILMSSPNRRPSFTMSREDTIVSSPLDAASETLPETCGHPEQERADIRGKGADTGDQNVRTKLVPTNSSSNSQSEEGLQEEAHAAAAAARQRARPKPNNTDEDRLRRIDFAIRSLPTADDVTIQRMVQGATLDQVRAARLRAAS